MFAVLDRVITHIAKLLCNKPFIGSAAELSVSNIQMECVILADKVIKTGLTHMLNVISGAEEAEISLIYTNSGFHRKALARAAPPAKKRQRQKSETYEQRANHFSHQEGES